MAPKKAPASKAAPNSTRRATPAAPPKSTAPAPKPRKPPVPKQPKPPPPPVHRCSWVFVSGNLCSHPLNPNGPRVLRPETELFKHGEWMIEKTLCRSQNDPAGCYPPTKPTYADIVADTAGLILSHSSGYHHGPPAFIDHRCITCRNKESPEGLPLKNGKPLPP